MNRNKAHVGQESGDLMRNEVELFTLEKAVSGDPVVWVCPEAG